MEEAIVQDLEQNKKAVKQPVVQVSIDIIKMAHPSSVYTIDCLLNLYHFYWGIRIGADGKATSIFKS